MYLVAAIIFLLSLLISFFIFLYINSKLNIDKWFNQNKMRKFIAFIIVLLIYSVGIMLIEKLNVVGNYNAIIRGVLVSTVLSTVVITNCIKN